MNRNEPQLWDEKAMARALGVKNQTPRIWRLRGGGPPFLKLGRRIRYVPAEVMEWAKSRPRYQSTSEYPKPEAAA